MAHDKTVMKGTIRNIQCLRGAAAFLVLIFHLVDIGQYFGPRNRFLDIVNFGQSGVDLFFVISGFIIYFIAVGKFQNRKYQKQFLIKRFFRIYPVYWFYSGIFLLALFSIHSERLEETSFGYVFYSFLLIPQKTFPLLGVGWTLIHEVFFYLFFSLLMFFKEIFYLRILLVWGLLIVVISFLTEPWGRWLPYFFSPFYLEFILGCLVAHRITNSDYYPNGKIITLAGLLVLIVGSVLYYIGYQDMPIGLMRILLFGLPAAIIVYGALALEKEQRICHSIFFHIGNGSYSIYLSHVIIIWVLASLYKMFLNRQYGDSVATMVLFCIIAVGAGILSYHIIEKPIIRLGKSIAQKI